MRFIQRKLGNKLKIKRSTIESELEPFEGRSYQQIAVDIKKIRSIKEAYPEEYKVKLENAHVRNYAIF